MYFCAFVDLMDVLSIHFHMKIAFRSLEQIEFIFGKKKKREIGKMFFPENLKCNREF